MSRKPTAVAIKRLRRPAKILVRGETVQANYKLTRINGQRKIHVRTQLPGMINKQTLDVEAGGGMTNDMVDDVCENPDYNVTITG
jgi:hypothetical protein